MCGWVGVGVGIFVVLTTNMEMMMVMMVMKTMTVVAGRQAGRQSHPEVVPGVAGVSRVVDEAVPSVVSLRQRHAQLGIDVLHELSAVMHRLQSRGREGEKMIASTSFHSFVLAQTEEK